MALRIRSRPSSPADTLATTPPRGLVYVSMGSERHEEGARRFAQAIVGLAIMIGAANIVSALAFVGATV